ncbi:hypothetical protein [Pseudonocardia nigra]|uniref:hypothetical protein n=1 Tax=Pseudonocardia nigra TaxID=1921578 RepID=UPI001C5E729C|nr:hypothetical protein [Pseudonocardia nigra]
MEPKYPNAADAVGLVWANAVVQRDDVTKLQQAVVKLIQEGLASLVPPVGNVVVPLVFPVVQPIITRRSTRSPTCATRAAPSTC